MSISAEKLAAGLVLCALVSLPATFGQVLLPGRCQDIPVVQNFSIPSYLGDWYEIERTFFVFSINGTCTTASYSDFGNGSVRVYNSQVNGRTGEFESAEGNARPADPSKGEAKLLVKFPFQGPSESPYWVLATDYTNYSVVWSCTNFGVDSLQVFWFLARDRNPSEEIRDDVHGILTSLNFNLDLLHVTNQSNCTSNSTLIN